MPDVVIVNPIPNNTVVVDINAATAGPQGIKGDKGDKGDTGERGPSGDSTTTFSYNANTATINGDPTVTKLSWNSATQTSSTVLRVNHSDADAKNNSTFLHLITKDDVVVIEDKNNVANFQTWEVTGAPTFQATWDEFPVILKSSGGSSFTNNQSLLFSIISIGSVGPQGPAGPDQTAQKVLYVSKSGLDTNDGTSLAKAKLTIKSAMAIATSDTTVFVKSGEYIEANPVTIPTKVALVGDSLRTVTIRPANITSDIFYVNNGSYITEVTFRGHEAPAAAVAYNPNGSAGEITQSPYVYNCSSITTTGTGMRVDGEHVEGGKSMVAAQYTQINQGGKGIHLLNMAYAQLIGIYTICCAVGILCEDGAFCSLIGSDTSFGTIGLKADGVSTVLYTGTAPAINVNDRTATITGLSQTPYANNVVSFDNGTTFYTISGVTTVAGGSSTLTFAERVSTAVAAGATARFYQSSRITAAGHTFEYSGSGNTLPGALPQAGGVPNQANEVVEVGGGQVYRTSTDQQGDFRIGNSLVINRGTGDITGDAFDRSLFAVMTPYILALES